MWLEWLELEIVPAVDISEMHLLKTPVEDWRLIASDSSINEYGEHGIPFSSNGIEALADGMFGALFAGGSSKDAVRNAADEVPLD